MATILISTTELEKDIRVATQKWEKKTKGVLTISLRCGTCWYRWNEHPGGVNTTNACRKSVLPPSQYFEALVSDLDEATRASIYYTKGLDDEDIYKELEKCIAELEGVLGSLR